MHVAVIPAYNEGATIGSVVIRTLPYVDEVIVIDDGSVDDTRWIAEAAGATVVSHEQNFGKGAAIRSGLEYVDPEAVDAVAVLDADGQHDPANLTEMFDRLAEGENDIIIGSRSRPGEGSTPRYRRFGRIVLNRITNLFGNDPVSDTQSGFRVFDAAAIETILPREAGVGVESEMLMRAQQQGLSVTEYSIKDHYPREAEASYHPVHHGLTVILSVLRTVRGQYPLTVFGTIGFVSLAIGFIFGYDTATHYYATREFWPGKAMLSMLFSIVGSQFLVGAAILDYLKITEVGESRTTGSRE